MKKLLPVSLIFVFGLSTIAQPSFAMPKGDGPPLSVADAAKQVRIAVGIFLRAAYHATASYAFWRPIADSFADGNVANFDADLDGNAVDPDEHKGPLAPSLAEVLEASAVSASDSVDAENTPPANTPPANTPAVSVSASASAPPPAAPATPLLTNAQIVASLASSNVGGDNNDDNSETPSASASAANAVPSIGPLRLLGFRPTGWLVVTSSALALPGLEVEAARAALEKAVGHDVKVWRSNSQDAPPTTGEFLVVLDGVSEAARLGLDHRPSTAFQEERAAPLRQGSELVASGRARQWEDVAGRFGRHVFWVFVFVPNGNLADRVRLCISNDSPNVQSGTFVGSRNRYKRLLQGVPVAEVWRAIERIGAAINEAKQF